MNKNRILRNILETIALGLLVLACLGISHAKNIKALADTPSGNSTEESPSESAGGSTTTSTTSTTSTTTSSTTTSSTTTSSTTSSDSSSSSTGGRLRGLGAGNPNSAITLSWNFAVTPQISGDGSAGKTVSSYTYEVKESTDGSTWSTCAGYPQDATLDSNHLKGSMSGADNQKQYKLFITKGTIDSRQYDVQGTCEDTLNTNNTEKIGDLRPSFSVPKYYLKWTVLVNINKITENGTETTTKGVNSITYKVMNGTNSMGERTFNPTTPGTKTQPITLTQTESTGIEVPGAGSYSIQLISCTIEGNTNRITISGGTSPVTSDVNNTFTINGSISGITVNAITIPSQYNNTVAGPDSGFKGDDHEELGDGGKITSSSLTTDRVKAILDDVYKNNAAGTTLHDGIAAIMSDPTNPKLSLVLYATDKSSSDHKDSLKRRAREFDGADDAELKKYFDVSLYVTKNGERQTDLKISEAYHDITMKYTIPKDAKLSSSSSSTNGKTRYFNVVRYHDGAHSAGIDEYQKNATTLNIKTSQFSDFALAYYDKSSSSSSSSYSSSARPASSSIRTPGTGASANTAGGGGGSAGGGKAPKTGDDFNAKKWVFFLVIGVVVALCSFILYQDTKEWRDENK